MDLDKILIELATLREQGRWAGQRFQDLENGQDKIFEKVEKLSIAHTALYWKVTTAAVLAALMITSLVELARAKGF